MVCLETPSPGDLEPPLACHIPEPQAAGGEGDSEVLASCSRVV